MIALKYNLDILWTWFQITLIVNNVFSNLGSCCFAYRRVLLLGSVNGGKGFHSSHLLWLLFVQLSTWFVFWLAMTPSPRYASCLQQSYRSFKVHSVNVGHVDLNMWMFRNTGRHLLVFNFFFYMAGFISFCILLQCWSV